MNATKKLTLILALALAAAGCAYLGVHGPSVQQYPQYHKNVKADGECADCHGPTDPMGPQSPHPNFKNCLKCHNDPLAEKK